MRYLSLFSGIEAASVACNGMGWEAMAFAEIDPFPSSVLAKRFHGVPNLGDVTEVNWRSFVKKCGRPDLVVGGSPCQSFSVAGTRTGLEGASGLMWEYVRAVREVRPEWVLWENVPGALSSSNGEDFRCLLEALDALGYGLAWRVLDAQFFGVAQRRERVFLVGRLGSRPPVEVLFEPKSVLWDSKSSREKRKELAAKAGRDTACAGVDANSSGTTEGMNIQLVPTNPVVCMTDTKANASYGGEVCGTLTSHAMKDAPVLACGDGRQNEWAVRRLTPRECERLQGFPDDWTLIPWNGRPAEECPDGPRYKAIGNSMAVPVMRWIFKRMDECTGVWQRSGSCD